MLWKSWRSSSSPAVKATQISRKSWRAEPTRSAGEVRTTRSTSRSGPWPRGGRLETAEKEERLSEINEAFEPVGGRRHGRGRPPVRRAGEDRAPPDGFAKARAAA